MDRSFNRFFGSAGMSLVGWLVGLFFTQINKLHFPGAFGASVMDGDHGIRAGGFVKEPQLFGGFFGGGAAATIKKGSTGKHLVCVAHLAVPDVQLALGQLFKLAGGV